MRPCTLIGLSITSCLLASFAVLGARQAIATGLRTLKPGALLFLKCERSFSRRLPPCFMVMSLPEVKFVNHLMRNTFFKLI